MMTSGNSKGTWSKRVRANVVHELYNIYAMPTHQPLPFGAPRQLLMCLWSFVNGELEAESVCFVERLEYINTIVADLRSQDVIRVARLSLSVCRHYNSTMCDSYVANIGRWHSLTRHCLEWNRKQHFLPPVNFDATKTMLLRNLDHSSPLCNSHWCVSKT